MYFYEDVLREFNKQKVKYVVVGGLATSLLAVGRFTADLDILVEMSNNNLAKVVKILTKQGYHVKQPVDPMGIADTATRNDWIKNKRMKAFNFYRDKDGKEVDIIIDTPVSFEKVFKKYRKKNCGNLVLPLISIDHLIEMKQKANRPIDRADILDLKIAKKLEKKK